MLIDLSVINSRSLSSLFIKIEGMENSVNMEYFILDCIKFNLIMFMAMFCIQLFEEML